jgi:16S rRNA processing protein RimM
MEPTARPPRPAAPSAGDEPLVELGPIVNCHGVRGEMRLLPHNPDSDAAVLQSGVVLMWPDGRRRAGQVRAARRHKRFLLVQLDGVDDLDAAEALVGCTVAVPRAALPAPEADAVYHADLIGCAVVTTAGEPLGTVEGVMVTGSNDVCVVRDGRREVLIPLIADVIAELDVAGRRLVVRPIPGLLDDDE